MVRKMAIILMVCVLGLGSCAFLNLDKKEEKDKHKSLSSLARCRLSKQPGV